MEGEEGGRVQENILIEKYFPLYVSPLLEKGRGHKSILFEMIMKSDYAVPTPPFLRPEPSV